MRNLSGLLGGALGGAIVAALFLFSGTRNGLPGEEAPETDSRSLPKASDGFEERIARVEARLDILLQRTESAEEELAPPVAADLDRTSEALGAEELPEAESALRAAGVTEARVDWLLELSDSISLEGLQAEHEALRVSELDDSRARRFEARRASRQAANERLGQLRGEHGDPLYDWLLYMGGRENRVGVSTVMRDSNAERGGLEPGDIILSYDDERVFRAADLREATQRGELGETVRLDVERDGRTERIRLERGPMGVQLNGLRVVPEDVP